ncbi:TetR family transcriptional regulator [Antricoccus suffuscus]|uniref:TetR family transcriptional regulator n=1 Tax=Antricoccus suffuscus TaxID=1629062 RepID=A0A2T1A2I4_9ACTN|nr:TetR/AcrR family transcriptional regulator [Antricoccus suffuscus]PRZ42819.1 TetR family transcriptional regulator [Antricoccus suffuscus]
MLGNTLTVESAIEEYRRRYAAAEAAHNGSRSDLRQKIMDATLELAASEGVAGASVRKIASAVEMRVATMYSYFPGGKDELVSEAMLQRVQEFYANQASGLRSDDQAIENLRSLVFRHVRWSLDHPKSTPAWEVIVASDRISPVLSEHVRSELERMATDYRALLVRLLLVLGVEAPDTAGFAEMLVILCNDAFRWTGRGQRLQQPLAAEEFAWIAIRGAINLRDTNRSHSHSVRPH